MRRPGSAVSAGTTDRGAVPAQYSRLWWRSCSAAVAAGVVVAAWQLSALNVVIGVVLDTVVVNALYALLTALVLPPDPKPARPLTQMAFRSLAIVTAVLAFSAFAALWWPMAVLGLTVAASTSPAARRHRTRREVPPQPARTESEPRS